MLKSKYLLTQEISCKMPGEFIIHELTDGENKEGEAISQGSDLQISPQQYVGKFTETGLSWICCCSFKPIKSLELQMYGQRLSDSSTESSCCMNVCTGQLVVSTTNKVLLGTISKVCECFGSSSRPFMTIEDQKGKTVFEIKIECCQWANLCPRLLKCSSQVIYTIFNSEGKEVGRILNVYRSCLSNICCLRDDFHIVFDEVDGEKEKILLLNAVVFINQLKHQMF